jgi:hypothetical protein
MAAILPTQGHVKKRYPRECSVCVFTLLNVHIYQAIIHVAVSGRVADTSLTALSGALIFIVCVQDAGPFQGCVRLHCFSRSPPATEHSA